MDISFHYKINSVISQNSPSQELYEKIQSNEITVKENDEKIIKEILKTELKGFCKKDCVCLSKSRSIAKKDKCPCDKKMIECDSNCLCEVKEDSNSVGNCSNRRFQKGEHFRNQTKIEEKYLRGIDLFTRKRIKKLLPDNLDKNEKKSFLESFLMEKMKKLSNDNKDASLLNCIKEVKNMIDSGKENLSKYCNAVNILLNSAKRNIKDFQSFSKGLCVFVKEGCSFDEGELLGEYLGEVYPLWRWYEREKILKSAKERILKECPGKTPLPDFYNMMLERHEDDPRGYNMLAIDARSKGTFVSRVSHSCDPNAKVQMVASAGKYRIGLYALKEIKGGEEITFDYFCRTDSESEMMAATCLCGSEFCRGSYLNYFEDFCGIYSKKKHTIYDKMALLVESSLGQDLPLDFVRHLKNLNLGRSVFKNLPIWAIRYTAKICEFIVKESEVLPLEILKYIRRKKTFESEPEEEERISQEEAKQIKNKRIQNLIATLSKLSYFLRFKGQNQNAPFVLAPLEFVIKRLFSDKDSLLNSLLRSSERFFPIKSRREITAAISAVGSVEGTLEGLERVKNLFLRVRNICWRSEGLKGANFLAAGDLLHLFANTKYFFVACEYSPFKSAFVDIGISLYKNGSCSAEHAFYDRNYPRNLLLHWHKDVDENTSGRVENHFCGAVLLPDIESCFNSYSDIDDAATSKYKGEERMRFLKCLSLGLDQFDPDAQGSFWGREMGFTFDNRTGLYGSPFFDELVDRRGNLANLINEMVLNQNGVSQ